jgi:molecular chaperone GrpE
MKKDKVSKDENEKSMEVNAEEINQAADSCEPVAEDDSKNGESDAGNGIEELKAQLEEKNRLCEEYKNMVQRTAAEFDNYKKRTIKEKEALSLDIAIDTVNSFLPVIDNLERAMKAAEEMESNPLKEGVEMVMRQIKECLDKLGVEAIEAVNGSFDPELHNAVMHVTDDESGENMVLEEFQKGYTLKGKVVRHSMVKVVN